MFCRFLMLLAVLAACGPEPAAQEQNTPATTSTAELVAVAASCPSIVKTALETTDSACGDTQRNQACYGNVRLDVEAQADAAPFVFEKQGDKVDLVSVRRLQLSSMSEASNEWGVALMKLQANLPDTLPGQNVTFLLFGDVEIDDTSAAGEALNPMQSFRFQSGISDSVCSDAPDSGILIQTPEGVGEITMRANGVDVTLASTAYLQADAGDALVVNMLEGEAQVASQGVVQSVSAGQQVSVPMDANLEAAGPPSAPRPYNLLTLDALPVDNLEREIEVAPNTPGSLVNITNEGAVEASSTYSGFPASLAVDGRRSTSWFSAGPGPNGEPSLYRWTGIQDDTISAVTLLSNAEHSEPGFRTGFGFGTATVQVLDADDNVVFEETVDLAGTPDPDITVTPDVVGRSVVLTLIGHEDPTCGGFGELEIQALR